jgi:hypothetical protein
VSKTLSRVGATSYGSRQSFKKKNSSEVNVTSSQAGLVILQLYCGSLANWPLESAVSAH